MSARRSYVTLPRPRHRPPHRPRRQAPSDQARQHFERRIRRRCRSRAPNRAANRLAHERRGLINAKQLDASKRKFLASACGAASTLLAFNAANAAAGRTGGFFDVPREAALDLQLARAQTGPAQATSSSSTCRATSSTRRKATSGRAPEVFVKDVFMDSDTDVMVLSFVPSTRDGRAGHDPGGRRGAPHRRQARGHAPAAAPRPRQPEPARRPRGHGRAAARSGASAPGRPTRSTGPDGNGSSCTDDVGIALHREGARARRQEHLRAQGAAVRPPVLRAQPVQRHRRGRRSASRT